MKKKKILVLLCILNLDLGLAIYLLSNNDNVDRIESYSILEERSDIKPDELYRLSIGLSEKFNQPHPTCFKQDLLQFDKVDNGKFYLDHGDLILRVLSNNEEYILNCRTGNMFRNFRGIKGREKTLKIEIDGFVWEELNKKNVDFEMIQMIIDLMLNYEDISNRPVDGLLKVVYNEYKNAEGFEILALQFKIGKKKKTTIYNHTDHKSTNYYDHRYVYVSSLLNKAPVKYGIITSWYDNKRIHPITKENRPHFGTDYAGTHGDPIYAISSGVIDKIEFKRNNGNYVKLDHGANIYSQYLHMDRFKKNLKKGDFVQKNDIIGYIGMTGLATAPHVCYRFWKNGRQINHLSHATKGRKMSKDLQLKVAQEKDRLTNILNNI